MITLRLPDDADFDAIGDRLEALGFPRPATETGVWAGGPDVLSAVSADLTPELGYLALDAEDHLVLASDQQALPETALRAATGDGDRVQGLDEVADAVGEPLSAAVYTGDYACGALAMAQADADDQARAADLVSAAGTVDPYLAFAMAAEPGGAVRVALEFADADQARTNADSRAALATGPAVGQGGDFADRFALRLGDGRRVGGHARPATRSRDVRAERPEHRPGAVRDLLRLPNSARLQVSPVDASAEAAQPQAVGDDEHAENAIAAPAIIGLSRPAAASGRAATL